MFLNDLANNIRNRQPNLVKCKKCKFTGFEPVDVYQYEAEIPCALGQQPAIALNAIKAVFLRCASCGTMNEPLLTVNSADKHTLEYFKFAEQIVKKEEE